MFLCACSRFDMGIGTQTEIKLNLKHFDQDLPCWHFPAKDVQRWSRTLRSEQPENILHFLNLYHTQLSFPKTTCPVTFSGSIGIKFRAQV